MDNRIFHLCHFAVIFKQFCHIAGKEYLDQTIDNPFDAVVEIGSGNVPEQFAQEWIRFWNQFCRLLPAESIDGWIVQTGSKHSVGNGLCIHIGKTFGRNIVNQYLLKRIHLVFECAVFLVCFVACEGLFDHIRKEPGFGGHHLCEFLRTFNRLPNVRTKVFNEVCKRCKVFGQCPHFPSFGGVPEGRGG